MERKKRSKGSVWEFCYANKIFGTFGDEIKASGRNWSNFEDTHTHAAKLVVEIYSWPIILPLLLCFQLALLYMNGMYTQRVSAVYFTHIHVIK